MIWSYDPRPQSIMSMLCMKSANPYVGSIWSAEGSEDSFIAESSTFNLAPVEYGSRNEVPPSWEEVHIERSVTAKIV